MWRRPLEWNLNGTTDPRDGSVDHLSLNSLKDRHGPIRAPKSPRAPARKSCVSPSSASRASSLETRGVNGPERQTHPFNPQTPSTRLRPKAGDDAARPQASAVPKKSPERAADRRGNVTALHNAG